MMETTLAGLEKYAADACGGYIEPIWETRARDEAFNREIIAFHFLGLIQGLYPER